MKAKILDKKSPNIVKRVVFTEDLLKQARQQARAGGLSLQEYVRHLIVENAFNHAPERSHFPVPTASPRARG